MKFTTQNRGALVPETNDVDNAGNGIPDLVWSKSYRDIFDSSQMQCLSLIRRQIGNVISMKIVMRSHEAE